MGEDGTKSCFLCDSKERLEMCSKCHSISTCVHHTHLHRWFVLLYFIILLPTWVKQEIPLSYILSAQHMFQRHWYRRVLPIHSGPREGSWQVLDCHLCRLYLCLCFCIFDLFKRECWFLLAWADELDDQLVDRVLRASKDLCQGDIIFKELPVVVRLYYNHY